MDEISVADAAPRDLLSVKQFSEKHPVLSQAALRALILNADGRVDSRGQLTPGNGLQEAGAILRLGRKVLLSESRVFAWILAQQQKRNGRRAA